MLNQKLIAKVVHPNRRSFDSPFASLRVAQDGSQFRLGQNARQSPLRMTVNCYKNFRLKTLATGLDSWLSAA
jgi:hypothetical protein